MHTSPPETRTPKWWWLHGVALTAIIIATFMVLRGLETDKLPDDQQPAPAAAKTDPLPKPEGEKQVSDKDKPQTAAYSTGGVRGVWWETMVLLAGFAIVAGHGITGYWFGALIDSRSKMSLSRFQMTLWTILIISAYLTSVVINIYRH